MCQLRNKPTTSLYYLSKFLPEILKKSNGKQNRFVYYMQPEAWWY